MLGEKLGDTEGHDISLIASGSGLKSKSYGI
jgi:hypothetical protein